MPAQSILRYVQVNVSLEGPSPTAAGFGTPGFLFEHAADTDRVSPPMYSLADITDYGIAAGSPAHTWATAVLAQQPRAMPFVILRRDSGDADDGEAFEACVDEDPACAYGITSELRTADELLALAASVNGSAYPKIHIAQSNDASVLSGDGPSYSALFEGTVADGTYILTFTGFGLVSPVTVTTTRTAGTPATLALVGDAFRTQLTTQLGTNLAAVLASGSIGGTGATVTFRIIDGLPTGTVVASGTAVASTADITVTVTDADVASRLFDLQYRRTALIYHPTDAQYLDAAWASRCLAFDLDVKKGIWAHKRLSGVTGTSLSNAQIAALAAVNSNWFAPAVFSSGVPVQAFTAQGWMGSGESGAGQRIDVTTTLDITQARLEEALLGVLLRETHGVPFTDAGINRFAAAANGVMQTLAAAGHYLSGFVVPETEPDAGARTPVVFAPRLSSLTSAQRQSRSVTFRILAYLQNAIEAVVFNVEIRN